MEKNWFLRKKVGEASVYFLDVRRAIKQALLTKDTFPYLWCSTSYVTASEKAQKMGPDWVAVSAAAIIEELLQ